MNKKHHLVFFYLLKFSIRVSIAVLSLIFAFLIPPVGIILSSIVLKNAQNDEVAYAKAGFIVGCIMVFVYIMVFAFSIYIPRVG